MREFDSSRIVVIGAGGHGRVAAVLAQRCGYSVSGFLDKVPGGIVDGIPVIDGDDYLDSTFPRDLRFAMGLGSLSTWERRMALCQQIDRLGLRAPRLVDPDALVMPSVDIERGTQILLGARIQRGVSIREWTVVNTAAVIEHDCSIDVGVHVAPAAVLCGGVTVGAGAFIGAGSTVKEGVTIGSRATIGMGAVVICDVDESQTVVGVPARDTHDN